MDMMILGLDTPLLNSLQHLMGIPEEAANSTTAPALAYLREATATASAPADVKECPRSYAFVVAVPGLRPGEINVQVEDGSVLVVSGERRREEGWDGKYLRVEQRVGKFKRKFPLPEKADADAVSAVCQDGVLTVTVGKKALPEPKKPKTIDVKLA